MTEHKNTKIIIPFFEGLASPFKTIKLHFNSFCILTSFFALITTIISDILGRSIFCGLEQDTSLYCSTSPFNAIASIIFLLIGFSLYLNRWDLITKYNTPIKETLKQFYIRRDIKAFLIIFINIILWTIIVISAYLLNTRQATPNFYLELGYFALFSSLILISIILLFNNVIFIRLLDEKKCNVLNKTLWPIFDNLYKFMLWFIIYFILFIQITRYIFLNVMTISTIPFIYSFICEFILYFIIYSIPAFWIIILRYQEKYLLSDEF